MLWDVKLLAWISYLETWIPKKRIEDTSSSQLIWVAELTWDGRYRVFALIGRRHQAGVEGAGRRFKRPPAKKIHGGIIHGGIICVVFASAGRKKKERL